MRRADHAVTVRQQLPAEPLGLASEPVLVRRLPHVRRHAAKLGRAQSAGYAMASQSSIDRRLPRGVRTGPAGRDCHHDDRDAVAHQSKPRSAGIRGWPGCQGRRAAGPVCRRSPWLPVPREPSGRRPSRERWVDQAQRLLACPASRHRHRRGRGRTMYSAKAPYPTPTTRVPDRGSVSASPTATTSPAASKPRRVRRLRAAPERAVGPREVGEVDTGSGDSDQDLALARARYRRVVDQTHVLRTIQRGLLQGTHGRGNAQGNQPFLLGLPHRGRPLRRAALPTM